MAATYKNKTMSMDEKGERKPKLGRSSMSIRRSMEQTLGTDLYAGIGAAAGRTNDKGPELQAESEVAGRLSAQISRMSLDNKNKYKDKEMGHEDGGKNVDPDFVPCREEGLTTEEAEALLAKWGKNELAEKKVPKWLIVFRLLTGPMPMMLWIAAIIEAIIGNYADMGILFGIQIINAAISFYETTKAADAVAALKKSLKPKATVKRNGKWEDMDATMVVPGDMVLLAAGSAIPADSWVNHGEIEVDQSAMTGESLPVKFTRGELCKMGSTVTRGETEGTVQSTGGNTFFGKTAAMLQSVDGSGGSLQTLLTKIMIYLVAISVILCSIAFAYLVTESQKVQDHKFELSNLYQKKPYDEIIKESLSFAVVLLVASIPVAIEIVTTTTLALGSRYLSGHGAIITRLSAIEEMAGMDMLCSDKTGTLTMNKMVIQDDCPTYTPGETKDTILFQAALAAKWKEPPRDALDTMVLATSGQDLSKCDAYEQLDFTPFDPRTKRTEGKLRGPNGSVFRITKGAPHVILSLCHNKAEIEPAVESKVLELGKRGIRSLAVARMDNEDQRWKMLGILTFLDPPRFDTKQTIEECRKYGVAVKMITGDHTVIAVETSRVLGLGTNIANSTGLPVLGDNGKVPEGLVERHAADIVPADGFAQVFPEHKYLIVETLRQAGFRCGMTGDGVNDAPALKRADVGIAVQGATDAARAAADIVLTDEGLGVVIVAIKLSREVFGRLKNFILYRISATLQLLCFFFIAVFALKPVDYYSNNFCPANLLDTAATSCYAAAEPLNTAELFNSAAFSADPSVTPIFMRATPRTCPRGEEATCSFNPKLYELSNSAFLLNSQGQTTTDATQCLKDAAGECIKAAITWPDFFQLPVLMLMLITLLNDGTLISIGYDRVRPNKLPEKWNFAVLFFVSSVLAGVALGSSLLLLWAALDSNNSNGLFAGLGIPPIEYGKVVTLIYLKVSVSDFLTLFSARTQGEFFWAVLPSKALMAAATIALLISTILACLWPEGELDGLPVMGLALGEYRLLPLWIWIYCIVFWFIQDACKVATIRLIERYGILQQRKTEWKLMVEEIMRQYIPDQNGNTSELKAVTVVHDAAPAPLLPAVQPQRRTSFAPPPVVVMRTTSTDSTRPVFQAYPNPMMASPPPTMATPALPGGMVPPPANGAFYRVPPAPSQAMPHGPVVFPNAAPHPQQFAPQQFGAPQQFAPPVPGYRQFNA